MPKFADFGQIEPLVCQIRSGPKFAQIGQILDDLGRILAESQQHRPTSSNFSKFCAEFDQVWQNSAKQERRWARFGQELAIGRNLANNRDVWHNFVAVKQHVSGTSVVGAVVVAERWLSYIQAVAAVVERS